MIPDTRRDLADAVKRDHRGLLIRQIKHASPMIVHLVVMHARASRRQRMAPAIAGQPARPSHRRTGRQPATIAAKAADKSQQGEHMVPRSIFINQL